MGKKFAVWVIDNKAYECELLNAICPMCYKWRAIIALPPPLLAKQRDGTTHVCAQFLGGCNHGFAFTPQDAPQG